MHNVTVQFITLAVDSTSQAWLRTIIRVRTISFPVHVDAGAAHCRGLGVVSGEVLAGQMASWVVVFRMSDLSSYLRFPLLGGCVLHPLRAGAPSLPISLSGGVRLPLPLL